MKRVLICLFVPVYFYTFVSGEEVSVDHDYKIIQRVIKQCTLSENKYSCMANKAAVAVERAAEMDIPLFDGLVLVHNKENVENKTTPRGINDGIGRLSAAAKKFLDSHVLKLDLTNKNATARYGDDHGKRKKGKKEKKYLNYALMVLMGVFGISGPLIMKTLAIIAGKALIASKIALIIVGAVALKKMFEKDPSHSKVKVHTHTVHDHEDEYDRNINVGAYKFLKTI